MDGGLLLYFSMASINIQRKTKNPASAPDHQRSSDLSGGNLSRSPLNNHGRVTMIHPGSIYGAIDGHTTSNLFTFEDTKNFGEDTNFNCWSCCGGWASQAGCKRNDKVPAQQAATESESCLSFLISNVLWMRMD